MVVRPAGWRWWGTGTRSTHGKEEGAAVAQVVGARLRGLTEEDSVLLEAMVPTARLPVPPPRKAPALGRPPPWEGGKSPPGSHGSLQLCWPRVCPLGGVGGGHRGAQITGVMGEGVRVTLDAPSPPG